MKNKIKVLITPSSFNLFFVQKYLKNKKIKFVYFEGPITQKKKLIEKIRGVDGVIIGSEILNREILSKAKKLKIIFRFGTSTENIDKNFCKEKQIKVKKLPPFLNSEAVSRHTLSLILALLHNIYSEKLTKKNHWNRKLNMDHINTTIGVIGAGAIGSRVIKLLNKLNYKVLYFSRSPKKFKYENVIYKKNIDDVIKKSSLISIHLKSNDDTKLLFNKVKLSLLKNKLLVNTARGNIIDENILFKLLKRNYIKGAALDVYNHEPSKGISLEVRKLKNVISTPHTAFYNKNTISKMCDYSLNEVTKFFK